MCILLFCILLLLITLWHNVNERHLEPLHNLKQQQGAAEITCIAYLLKRMKANRVKQKGIMITISGRQQVSPRVYLEGRAKEMLSCLLAFGYIYIYLRT